MMDETQISCFLLGGVLGIFLNYHKLIHGCDSRDVVRSTFVDTNGECYKFKPRVVACVWHQIGLY